MVKIRQGHSIHELSVLLLLVGFLLTLVYQIRRPISWSLKKNDSFTLQLKNNPQKEESGGGSNNVNGIALAVIPVISMQRSSSTYTSKTILNEKSPCYVHLNEIFLAKPQQSGDAWPVDGKGVRKDNGEQLADFVTRVARRRCQEKWIEKPEQKQVCQNKCIAGYKHFNVHLQNTTVDQQVWRHMMMLANMTAVVLERDVEQRWKSKSFAHSTGDWNAEGYSTEHQSKLSDWTAPEMPSEFLDEQKDWFDFVRETVGEDRRVEVTFEESTENPSKVLDRINHALPKDFQGLLLVQE